MPDSPPIESASLPGRFSSAVLWVLGAVLCICCIVFVMMTRHWPVVQDAALLRYADFLIHRGWMPYRDFVDINMPGSFALTAFGMHLAGSQDVSWRIFDLGLIALAGVGYFLIARPYSRFAALFATAMLLLVHGQDGVQQAGQRDEAMAALLILALAFLLEAVRRERWAWLVPFGLAVGLSTTIKPTAGPMGVVLLLIAAVYAERGSDGKGRAAAWIGIGMAAMAVPMAAMLLWLESNHAVGAWIETQRIYLPYYASLGRRSMQFALLHSISPLLSLVLLWLLCVALRGPKWPRFERWLLIAATLMSLLGLVVQGKTLPYQRYPMLASLLLLIALDLTTAWRSRRTAARYAALAGLCCACLVLAPLALARVHRFVARPQEFDAMLAADLESLGTDLDGRVQCLDTVGECTGTLYDLRLLPATHVPGDLFLFGPESQPAVRRSQQQFMQEVEAKPPLVFVVVSGFFLGGGGYRKLDRWPAFKEWLEAHYTLRAERKPKELVRWWSRAEEPSGYRLYVWKGDPARADGDAPLSRE